MTSVMMPLLRQVPSPNYSPVAISHDLVIVHLMEGGYEGSVVWLCSAQSQASAHLCMNADGSEFTQLVPLSMKAWAECAFNSRGISLEIPGFTQQGIPDARWRAAARIVAWLCQAYAIPPAWAQSGQGRGVCQHHDLGAAGGGHVDCSGVGSPTWMTFVGYVKDAYDAFSGAPLPPWALHGLPAPQSAELPPAVTPTPSHGGAARNEPGDAVSHPTASGYPLASIGDWQWRLRQVGANPSLGIDGDEGAATDAAIRTFQRAEGLAVTNDVNAETWAKLLALTGGV